MTDVRGWMVTAVRVWQYRGLTAISQGQPVSAESSCHSPLVLSSLRIDFC